MGRGWINTIKTATAQKKGAQFTKIAREITVAARMGGPDPNSNSRLRIAVAAAKDISCPKDTIERAIKKGAGVTDGDAQIDEILYEGYGPHGTAFMVLCQTDNRNRTVGEIRNLFKVHNGNLGESNSVGWMFERVSIIMGVRTPPPEDAEVEAIEAGANEVEKSDEKTYTFIGAAEDLDHIRTILTQRGWEIQAAEMSFQPKNTTEIKNPEHIKEVKEFLEALNEHDDSHRVYTTAAI